MKTKKHKLTLNLGDWHMGKLNAYCKRTEQNYTEAFKCWITGLPDEPKEEEVKRAAASPPPQPATDGGEGEGGGSEAEGA